MPQKPADNLLESDYPKWLLEEIALQQKLAAMNHTARTTKGDMEYALLGEGPVVLGVHGGPGGFDQTLFLFDWVTKAGFSLLAPSRPGYLGTPITTGKTPSEQADAFAALMDTLGIEKVALVCGSAGGPSGYEFAIRHPDRITSFVAVDAVVSRYLIPVNATALTQAIFLSGPGEQLINYFSTRFPKQTLHELIGQESLLRNEQIEEQVKVACHDPAQVRAVLRLVHSMSDYPRRRAGVDNDMAQFADLPDLPVDKIRCPSLIIHGTHDSDVLFYHGVYAWQNIPNSQHFWVREGSHFCAWISPKVHEVQERIISFLQTHH